MASYSLNGVGVFRRLSRFILRPIRNDEWKNNSCFDLVSFIYEEVESLFQRLLVCCRGEISTKEAQGLSIWHYWEVKRKNVFSSDMKNNIEIIQIQCLEPSLADQFSIWMISVTFLSDGWIFLFNKGLFKTLAKHWLPSMFEQINVEYPAVTHD